MEIKNEFIEAILNNNNFSIAIVNTDCLYIFVNDRWLNAHRLTNDLVIGSRPEEFHANTLFSQVLETQKAILGHEIILEPSMEVSCCNYYPLLDNYGNLIGAVVLGFSPLETFSSDTNDIIKHLTQELKQTKNKLHNVKVQSYTIDNIRGKSLAINKLRDEIRSAANSNSNVLVEGETGTGKELVARSIHNLSKRNNRSFVAVNCSAIPQNLIESELFGYDGGAFTGAKKEGKPGKFELANEGTILLDEINSMDITMQPKLLRVLQEREIVRVGGISPIPFSARLIAISNMPLSELLFNGSFRKDLFYRINVLHIIVPPLRDRLEDIPDLIYNTIKNLNGILDKNIHSVEPLVMELLQDYSWPGNVRELQNVVERAMNQCNSDTLALQHFSGFKQNYYPDIFIPISPVQEISSHDIKNALASCNGNKSNAAKLLKISRATLYNKMKKFQ